jgi:hypothetical protein
VGLEQDSSTNLTVNQCEEVAAALFEDIAAARNRKGQVATVSKGYAIWRR